MTNSLREKYGNSFFNLNNNKYPNKEIFNFQRIQPTSQLLKQSFPDSFSSEQDLCNPLPIAEPASICERISEDNFMLDSLNDHPAFTSHDSVLARAKQIKNESEISNSYINESNNEDEFMNALAVAINHFEKDEEIESKKLPTQITNCNTTTTNSEKHDDKNFDYELMKMQHNFLQLKYDELQSSNKKLMDQILFQPHKLVSRGWT